jgi:hypothetical protein
MVVTPERFNRESRTRRLDSPPDRVAGPVVRDPVKRDWPLKTSGNDNSSFRGVFEMASSLSQEVMEIEKLINYELRILHRTMRKLLPTDEGRLLLVLLPESHLVFFQMLR